MHYLFPADSVWDVNFSPDPAERHVKVNGVALPCSLVSVEMEADRTPVVRLEFRPEHLHLHGFPEGRHT